MEFHGHECRTKTKLAHILLTAFSLYYCENIHVSIVSQTPVFKPASSFVELSQMLKHETEVQEYYESYQLDDRSVEYKHYTKPNTHEALYNSILSLRFSHMFQVFVCLAKNRLSWLSYAVAFNSLITLNTINLTIAF